MSFFWAIGIENAHILEMGVDELAWTGHRARWREDLALARGLGVSHIRYGLPWAELNPAPGVYEWGWADEVIAELERLGLEAIWDLVHFGTPAWLEQGFLDRDFVGALEAYASAFARRYAGRVNRLTPLNEPYISTYFRAGWGIWPPYLKGRAGFVRMLFPIVEGVRAAIRAIRTANPEAEIWLNDAADFFHPATPDLAGEAARRTLERYAAFDLLLGLTRPGQESYEWLKAAGYPEAGLRAEPVEIEVIGLDYYPETEHELYRAEDGTLAIRVASEPLGLARALADYHARYGRPLFVAETSATHDPVGWLEYTLDQVRQARAGGVWVRGYTWWPLFDFYDWDSLLTRLEGRLCPVGLYRLSPTRSDRQPTPAAERFRRAVAEGI
ncbi:Beta-glucosidase B [Calidithermus roseus]|uniref:Beta-glucosidase B n=1 Tax=Calidithermus roseus TaxID=1644118 RepID=A0A399ES34_9DEIN|nr:family 1 glycosylhydrolase [Calidithermus roseus]RIH87477.1 Beta-glucosidase B [Calidithermus roseus]